MAPRRFPLRFPARKQALSVRLAVTDLPGLYNRARREMAEMLRGLADANDEPLRTGFREAADLFEEGIQEDAAPAHVVLPLKPKK